MGPGESLWLPEDRDKAKAYDLARTETCPKGHREEDWVDDEGFPHDPPLLEPVVRTCTACSEMARLTTAVQSQARMAAGTGPGAQDAMERALAGVVVVVEPFDPQRGIGVERGEEE